MKFKIDENLPVEVAQLLRGHAHDKSHVLGIMQRLIGLFVDENLCGRLWIVEENKLRIRG